MTKEREPDILLPCLFMKSCHGLAVRRKAWSDPTVSRTPVYEVCGPAAVGFPGDPWAVWTPSVSHTWGRTVATTG